MASGHIASIGISTRTAQHNKIEAAAATSHEPGSYFPSSSNQQSVATEAIDLEDSLRSDNLAKVSSVLSLSDDDDCSPESSSQSLRQQRKLDRGPRIMPSKLVQLKTIQDIDSNFNNHSLYHYKTLARLEEKWLEISQNLDTTVKHLEDCSSRVTESSSNCLQALLNSVGTTCDSVDGELKAFYDLMTKCDELTTKLSIAGSFRDEIKTLRKSVETLEQLYKLSQK